MSTPPRSGTRTARPNPSAPATQELVIESSAKPSVLWSSRAQLVNEPGQSTRCDRTRPASHDRGRGGTHLPCRRAAKPVLRSKHQNGAGPGGGRRFSGSSGALCRSVWPDPGRPYWSRGWNACGRDGSNSSITGTACSGRGFGSGSGGATGSTCTSCLRPSGLIHRNVVASSLVSRQPRSVLLAWSCPHSGAS